MALFVVLMVLLALPASAQEWAKYVNGEPWMGEITLPRGVISDTLVITEVISNTAALTTTITLTDTWPIGIIMLKGYNFGQSAVITYTLNSIAAMWIVPPGGVVTPTKLFEINTRGTWITATLTESLSNGDSRDIIIKKASEGGAANIPTFSQWGVIIFAVLLGFTSLVALRRRQKT
jgi:hypothetical protein